MKTSIKLITFCMMLLILNGCDQSSDKTDYTKEVSQSTLTESTSQTKGFNKNKNVYFGNLHVHTSWSFDGYTNGCVTDPEDAYRWAQGESIPGVGDGSEMQIKIPLDWYAVSEHAEYMGVFKNMENPNSPLSKLDIAKRITSEDQDVAFAAFAEVLDGMNKGISQEELSDPELAKSMWQEIINTTEKHNKPGKFTTFAAFEWTSAPNNRNLHRVVLFKNNRGIPEMTYSTLDSNKPEKMEQLY